MTSVSFILTYFFTRVEATSSHRRDLIFGRNLIKKTNFNKMQGLTIASLKKHPALIPLYACMVVGASGAIFYLFRLATKNPDVSWNKKSNPEPWEAYRNKQYKFYSPIRDYSNIESPAPKYQDVDKK